VDEVRRTRGRPFAPQLVDEAIARDDLVPVQQEDGEQPSLLRRPERQPSAPRPHLERAENEELAVAAGHLSAV
jgi:hypothetical protein